MRTVLSLILAGVVPSAALAQDTPRFDASLSGEAREFVRSIIHPTDEDVAESMVEVRKLKDLHDRAREVWKQAFALGEPDAIRERLRSDFMESADPWPRIYRRCASDVLDCSNEELLTVEATDLGCSDDSSLPLWTRMAAEARIDRWNVRWEYLTGLLFHHVLLGQYAQAAEAAAAVSVGDLGPNERKRVLELLSRLRA